ncbi:MAG: hypothetical protein LUD52_06920 [Opitutae bacterium]|nr:hypothetical protein [Opitutae bacterium]
MREIVATTNPPPPTQISPPTQFSFPATNPPQLRLLCGCAGKILPRKGKIVAILRIWQK